MGFCDTDSDWYAFYVAVDSDEKSYFALIFALVDVTLLLPHGPLCSLVPLFTNANFN